MRSQRSGIKCLHRQLFSRGKQKLTIISNNSTAAVENLDCRRVIAISTETRVYANNTYESDKLRVRFFSRIFSGGFFFPRISAVIPFVDGAKPYARNTRPLKIIYNEDGKKKKRNNNLYVLSTGRSVK